jgi:hypothetical protein
VKLITAIIKPERPGDVRRADHEILLLPKLRVGTGERGSDAG